MKISVIIKLFLVINIPLLAQTPNNTWISGSNEYDKFGVYGTKGIADVTNLPGARNASASWVDKQGNFWLFGGFGLDSEDELGNLNDMWYYNIESEEWTWIGGSNLINGSSIYGTQGVGSISNIPGARSYAATWVDTDGNLWLFSGNGFNDLWMFQPENNEWTWVMGDGNLPNYGSLGVANSNNTPGGRSSAVTWSDSSGNLWLFGGNGFDNSGFQGSLNDLWKFSTTNQEWTWIGGSHLANQIGVYGTQGIGSANNIPGARYRHVSWLGQDGKLWLFGGRDDIEENGFAPVFFSDLWNYNPSNNEWTWVSGNNNTENLSGSYGEKGVSNAANHPGTREHATTWTDDQGNLWLFGGWGFDGEGLSGSLNDFWLFQPSIGEWIWMDGSDLKDQLGVYGTLGVPDIDNSAGARLDAVPWIDNNGNLWLFGGEYLQGGRFNDLWRIDTYQWYADADQDGFGDPLTTLTQFLQPPDFILDNKDCDDTNSSINPDGTDVPASGIDSNCDGLYVWYTDEDGDGFPGTESTSENSTPGTGEYIESTDCDDNDADRYPDAPTLPDGKDNDCDGVVDKLDQTITFNALEDVNDGSGEIVLEATSTSMLQITYTLLGPATLDGSTLTPSGPGTISITASQEGNEGYHPAGDVVQSFCVMPQPMVTSTINGIGSLTLSSNYESGNQWFLDSSPISGASGSEYIVAQGGIFYLEVSIDGCVGNSDNIEVLLTSIGSELSNSVIDIYPNPVVSRMTISSNQLPDGKYYLSILDLNGKTKLTTEIVIINGESAIDVELDNLMMGSYIVVLSQNTYRYVQRIIKK